MVETGIHKISLLRRYYIKYQLVADAFFSVSAAGLVMCFGYSAFSLSWWWSVLPFILFFGCLVWVRKQRMPDMNVITSFLNLKYPGLEESSELTLKDTSSLNLLEQMQLTRIENVLQQVPLVQWQFTHRLRLSILVLLIAALFGYEVTWLHGHWHDELKSGAVTEISKNTAPEKILPQIRSVNLKITPPSYTRKSPRDQDKFAIEAEEGGVVNWELELNMTAREVALVFNNGEKVMLSNSGNTTYKAQKKIDKPGFYQVAIDEKLSDFYQIQVIKDNPPVIHIKAPQQYTYIDAGEAKQVNLNAVVDDDYGVSKAFIYTTVAKGSGEAVKFKEQKIEFPISFSNQNIHYDLKKLIDLSSLHMEPGDELYFYIQAQDSHNQSTRTDVHIVSLQDTAQLLSMDGLLSGVNVKPEFFRSERQIILDSEQLLREKDSISKENFDTRSNDLGNDQKLLRLRYGKFLGEESESDINPKEEQNDAIADPNNYGNAAVVLDKYTDKHDNAEDAQFFDPGVKAQLKATLTEMWKAELQLRLYKPEAALPFEYKALRLLKDLQQKSRVYVAKTAYNPSPLKMEKRLSGDLGKIIQPVDHQNINAKNDQYIALKNAVQVLESLKINKINNNADIRVLQQANQQLSEKAAVRPELYLSAVNSLHQIISNGKATNSDIGIVEKAIQRILPDSRILPAAAQNGTDMGLSKSYYQNLGHK